MWWNFLDKFDEMVFTIIVLSIIGTLSLIGLITVIKWIIKLF